MVGWSCVYDQSDPEQAFLSRLDWRRFQDELAYFDAGMNGCEHTPYTETFCVWLTWG
jgi:hypothetical protein